MHYLRTAAMVFALAFLLACGGGDGPVVMDTGGGGELGSDVGDQDSVGSDDSTEDAVRPDADVVDDSSGKPDGHTPKQGEFDWPCNGNDECHSGLCVEGAEGPVCTKLCQLGECPDGWYCRGMSVGPDVMSVCIPEGANLCKPCKVDTQCGHGVCLELGDEKFCTRNCSRLDDCPEGYECQEITHNERLTKECIPVLGTCSCGKSNHGEERPCVNRNAVGVCQGFETCDKDLGWVGCTALEPSPEICDGIDNDCNGVADDNPRMPEEECYNETPGVEGRCKGTWSCGGEAGWQCIGPSPAAEECNYRDDNCDGEIDEDFKDSSGRYVTMEHCGQCNNSCLGRIPFAEEIVCAVPDDPEEAPFCQVDKCQSGWVLFNNSCVPPLSSLCMPCSEDSDCGYANDKCVLLEGEGYCGRDCSPEAVQGTECPDGFTCTEIDGVGSQCIPTSGTCQCTVSNNGVKRPCENTNAFGTCIGAQVCDGLLGWGPCSAATPEEEVCDGIDNDCNGYIDDVDIESAPYCANQTGVCEGARQSCGGAAGWLPCNTANYVANSPFYEQMEISCDGLDNDCNGLIDDGPAPLCEKQEGVCAGKTKPCDGAGGSLECDASVYGPDYQEVETLCDGLDNDCNGIIDDPWPNKGKACSKGLGECYATGVIVCTANQLGVECNAPEIEGDDEICDGKDNDCDGKIDEDFPDLGQGCFAGVGECRRFGTMVCNANGDGTVCNAIAGPVADELCDGLDNNCDGDTDEDWPDKGKVCLAGQGQCQASGVYRCKSDGSGLECDAVEGTPTDEVCDYLDNDCNGVVDNGFIDADGRYTADTACANCFTDCTTIWVSAVHHATGVCNATPAVPTCTFVCDEGWVDADQNPDNGCEMFIDVGAVYVSTPYNGGTDNASCGAWDAPCETITYAIGRAGALSRPRVLVSEGIYAENITLVNGISVKGGYSATWRHSPETNVTVIYGTTPSPGTVKHKRAVIAQNITSATEFSGFTIYGETNFYQATGDTGGNSYAIWVKNCSSALVIKDNVIYGGQASSGANGAAGAQGANGGDGGVGANAFDTSNRNCPGASSGAGGAGGASTCGVAGGKGADTACPYNNSQRASGANGLGTGAGTGGAGGYDRYTTNCNTGQTGGHSAEAIPGTNGANGANGARGNSCTSAAGSISGDHWVGNVATAGTAGTSGAGGGGGGAGGGLDVQTTGCSGGDTLGSAGGGGGAGGCAGQAGAIGQPGGASIGIFIVGSNGGTVPVITNNHISRNAGGNGGSGGNGGMGGIGGQGGNSGTIHVSPPLNYVYAIGSGGFGGNGGWAGAGGAGGGGCGGNSYGILSADGSAVVPNYCDAVAGNVFSNVGGAGNGGAAGTSQGHAQGPAGVNGEASNCKILN